MIQMQPNTWVVPLYNDLKKPYHNLITIMSLPHFASHANPTKHLDGPLVYNDLKKPYQNLITIMSPPHFAYDVNPTKHLDGPFIYNDLKKLYHNLITDRDRHTLWMIRTQPSKASNWVVPSNSDLKKPYHNLKTMLSLPTTLCEWFKLNQVLGWSWGRM